jgi:hypothetical protein
MRQRLATMGTPPEPGLTVVNIAIVEASYIDDAFGKPWFFGPSSRFSVLKFV